MRINIDTDAGTLIRDGETVPLYSKAGFEQLSRLWVKVGWNEKYAYTFSWMGRPIIQLPEDLVRIQEVIWNLRPTLIIETGVAHGGSLIYYASLCEAMHRGRVIGVDIEIRPPNRSAIEEHPLSQRITLIEGDSIGADTLDRVRQQVSPDDRVLVVLDSCHTTAHVALELEAYHGFVSPGSYIVATDGVMRDLHDVPRGDPAWAHDHPSRAALEFAASHPNFVLEQPDWPFNESTLTENVTHWPSAWLRRVR
jgi:cephalosporin hydroxylase